MFIQQSEEYVRQIEAEIERLQQLRDQVQATIQGEEALSEAEIAVPRKRAAKKAPGKKATSNEGTCEARPSKEQPDRRSVIRESKGNQWRPRR